MIEPYPEEAKIEGVTAAILAGGTSSRMGTNKALLEVDGEAIIARSYHTLARLFHEVVIVTNTPEDYDFLPCRTVPDIYPGFGSIAGLHSALAHSTTKRTFVTACDMPFVDPAIIRYLCELQQAGYDAVIPYSSGGQEPLHAVYSSDCRNVFESAIQGSQRKILDILARMKTRLVPWDEIQHVQGAATSFLNVNTPEEYGSVSGTSHSACAPSDRQKKN
jgi:molybdopterin-guanine dinucleotide biosynthesis protein A